jgi:hypothetical protein
MNCDRGRDEEVAMRRRGIPVEGNRILGYDMLVPRQGEFPRSSVTRNMRQCIKLSLPL